MGTYRNCKNYENANSQDAVPVADGPAINNLYMNNLSLNSFRSSDTAQFSSIETVSITVIPNY